MFINRRATLVTEATPDYQANDLCGGKLSWTMRTPGGGLNLTRLRMLSLVSPAAIATKMYLFDADPSATTFTENGAFSVNSADRMKLIHVVEIAGGDWKDYTGRAGVYFVEKALAVPVLFASGVKIIYGAFVVEGALNCGTTADLEAMLGGQVD